MSLLNGGSGKRTSRMTDTEYAAKEFIPGITDSEWAKLARMPSMPDWIAVVSAVARMRDGA